MLSKDIHELLVRIGAIIVTICLNIGWILKTQSSQWTGKWGTEIVIGASIVSIFMSSIFPDWISGVLSSNKWYRRLIVGETWVEGAWLLESSRPKQTDEYNAQHKRLGVVVYSYTGKYLSLRTEGRHLEFVDITNSATISGPTIRAHEKLWSESDPILALSKLAFMSDSLTYVNIFSYDRGGEGTATGWFRSGREKLEEFTAMIVTKEGEVLRQWGRKLDDDVVRKLKKRYPNWEDVLIRYCFVNEEVLRSDFAKVAEILKQCNAEKSTAAPTA